MKLRQLEKYSPAQRSKGNGGMKATAWKSEGAK